LSAWLSRRTSGASSTIKAISPASVPSASLGTSFARRKTARSRADDGVFRKSLEEQGIGEWIGLRKVNDKSTLTYKNRKGLGISDTEEIEVEVEDFDKTAQLLSKLGCWTGLYYQENKRELWDLEGVEIAIDEWPFLEPFVEVEGPNETEVRKISEKLGFDYSKAIFSSTDEQYSAKYGISEAEVVNKIPSLIRIRCAFKNRH